MVRDAPAYSAALLLDRPILGTLHMKHTESTLMCLIFVCPLPRIPLQSPFMHKDSTYRINVYTFNKTLEFADRIKRIDVSTCVCVCK